MNSENLQSSEAFDPNESIDPSIKKIQEPIEDPVEIFKKGRKILEKVPKGDKVLREVIKDQIKMDVIENKERKQGKEKK